MGSFVNHNIEGNRNSGNGEYISKLIDIVNAIDYFLYEYSKNERVILIGEKHPKIMKHFM